MSAPKLTPSSTKTKESYTLPTAEALKAAGELEIKDEHGTSFPFKTLYADNKTRQVIFFIRHFYCGIRPPSIPSPTPLCSTNPTHPQSCEDYIRSLTPIFPPSVLAKLDPPTKFIFIGCGSPDNIPRYRERNTRELKEGGEEVYEFYCDPGQGVYEALGMIRTMAMPGVRPGYITTGTPYKALAGEFVLSLRLIFHVGVWGGVVKVLS